MTTLYWDLIYHVKDDKIMITCFCFVFSDQNDSDDDYEKISNQSGQIDPKVRSGLCQFSFSFIENVLNYQGVESFVA